MITKAANYILQPGQGYEGSWHVEGMQHEHIIASGIFYYSTTSNLSAERGGALAFREKRANAFHYRQRSQSLSFSANLGKVRLIALLIQVCVPNSGASNFGGNIPIT